MIDPVITTLNDHLNRMDSYERMVPICDECGQKLTADEYYWNMNSTILCERCLMKFRRNIEDYSKGGE